MPDTPEQLFESLIADKAIIVNAAPVKGESSVLHTQPVVSRADPSIRVSLVLGKNLFDVEPMEKLYTEKIYADGRMSVAQFPEWNQALGAFFSIMEMHSVSENEAFTEVDESVSLDAFHTHIDNWSQRARRHYLLDGLLEGEDPRLDPIQENGSFRYHTEPSSAQNRFITELLADTTPNPGHCYETALRPLQDYLDNDRVAYAEGVALPKYGGAIQEHAWIEIDDIVVEPTWPWHTPTPPEDAIYYGFTMKPRDVYETVLERGYYGTVLVEREDFTDYFESAF